MGSSHISVACDIARYHFKPIVGETVRILLNNPGSSLANISTLSSSFFEKHLCKQKPSFNPISDKQRTRLIKDALAVLIQHGIVYFVERQPPQKSNPSTFPKYDTSHKAPTCPHIIYYVDIQNILFRPRLPLYLGFARRRFGDVGQAAVRILFERGRLTSHQIFKYALNHITSDLDITEFDAEACLTDMTKSGLLQWCGKRGNSFNAPSVSLATDVTSTGTKRKHSSVGDDDEWGSGDEVGEEYIKIHVGNGDHRHEVGSPTKRNDADLWGICFWHLNREFRNECCAMVVQGRVKNDLAIKVLRAGLQLALDGEDCQQPSGDFETTEISTHAVQKLLEEQSGGTLSAQDFWEATQMLIGLTPAFVLAIPEHAPTHLRFIPGRLVAEVRQKTLENIILSRYGPVGRRVFRAMAIEGGMEEKMLAEKCMLPLKVVREHVFHMYQDRIVIAQEVPRSHDQTRASNWYYLWTVNSMMVYRNILEVMYKTVSNLFVRLESIDVDSTGNGMKKKLEGQELLLTGSILRMDQSIMVMRDFGPISAAYLPARYTVVDGIIGKVKRKK